MEKIKKEIHKEVPKASRILKIHTLLGMKKTLHLPMVLKYDKSLKLSSVAAHHGYEARSLNFNAASSVPGGKIIKRLYTAETCPSKYQINFYDLVIRVSLQQYVSRYFEERRVTSEGSS